MKTLLLILLTTIATAQSEFRFNTKETGNIGVIAGLNTIGVEIEYSGTVCARLFVTTRSIGGAIGMNFTSGMYEKFIYYTAFRLHKKSDVNVAIAGLELGVNYWLSDYVFVGVRGSYDLKVEKNQTTTTPNGFLKLGFRL